MATDLYIKNMVCGRCILVVRNEIINLNLTPVTVDLGIATVQEDIDNGTRIQLQEQLLQLGFELLDSAKSKLIERLKNIIIEKVHHTEHIDMKVNWSDLLSDELHYEYNHLSSLFSSVEGMTIEQFIIRQKIERAKELLFYDELNLSEISYKLGYSSVQHLSTQFKKVTGQTPSQFKNSRNLHLRKPLDGLGKPVG